MSERTPELMRNLLMERIRGICMGKADGTTQDLYHLAGAINKSIELECRKLEAKVALRRPAQSAASLPQLQPSTKE
jgi:hypothetical protein